METAKCVSMTHLCQTLTEQRNPESGESCQFTEQTEEEKRKRKYGRRKQKKVDADGRRFKSGMTEKAMGHWT